MKSRCFLFFVMFFLAVSLILAGGSVGLAADYVWDGSCLQPDPGIGLWTCDDNWTPSGEPTNSDNVEIADPSPTATCKYDLTTAISIGDLLVAGSSPTKMTLHVSGTSLTTTNLDLDDYGQLDVDQNFTVSTLTTLLRGSLWIDVASSKTCDLEDVDVADTLVHLTAITSGTLKADEVTLDSQADTATRAFKFSGGTITVENKLLLKAAQTAGSYISKLWVAAGTVSVTAPGATKGILEIDGGNSTSRKVELDIDDTLTAEQTDVLSGQSTLDVASGKTMKGGDVTFKAGAVMTKTGTGTFRSGS